MPIRLSYVAKATAVVVLVLAVAYAILQARSALIAIFLGLFIAAGIEPFVARMSSWGLRRGVAVSLVVLIFVVAVGGVVLMLVVPAANQLSAMTDSLSDTVDDAASAAGDSPLGTYLSRPDIHGRLTGAADTVGAQLETLAGALLGAVGGVLGFLSAALTVGVLTVYFSLAMPRLRERAHRLARDPRRTKAIDAALSKVGAYVTGQGILCAVAGATAYLALSLLGVPYAAALSLLVLFLDAIPQVGAAIGSVVSIAVALSVGVPQALGAAAFFGLYQSLENYLLAPRVFSQTINLTPLTALLAVLVGATIAGVLGAIVALPLTAAAIVAVATLRLEPAHDGAAVVSSEEGEP